MEKNEKLIENAIEIAMNNLRELQNILDMGRDRIISDYITKWAEEAETEYQQTLIENGGEYPYYDFIDEFSERKLNEVKSKYPIEPFLYTLTTQWNVDGEFSSMTHVFRNHDKAMAYMKKMYDYECTAKPDWTDKSIHEDNAHVCKEGDSAYNHVVWMITKSKVK